MSAELATIDKSAVSVVSMLEHAKEWLATAVETTGPAEIAAAKAQIATAHTYTKELQLSKDIQDDAAEMVRRAEYALRKATTKAQEAGAVADRSYGAAVRDGTLSAGQEKVSPKSFFTTRQEYQDANAMAALDGDDFDSVIDEAKADGNLSRANVARLAREKSGKPPLTDRNFQEAELVTAFRSMVRPLLKPKNVATLSPKARALLIDLLNDAIETLKGADQ